MNILTQMPDMEKSKNTFYPTPRSVSMKMARLVNWKYVCSVLEPSAGKGDLAREAAYELYKRQHDYYPGYESAEKYIPKADVDCVEIDKNLSAILRDKGFRVVHDDFLTFFTQKRYDLILMNPPFSDGAKHFLKALDMMSDGGQVVCLLNAQTIKNPYCYERQKLVNKLNELGATIEYMPGAFAQAERGTDTEIAMIYVSVESAKDEENSLILEHLRPAHKYADSMDASQYESLAKGNFIDAILDRYNFEVECGIKLIQEYTSIRPLIQDRIEDDSFSNPILQLVMEHEYGITINEYVRRTRKKYWRALFQSPKFMNQLTSNLQNELYNRVNELADYEFSAYNIYQLMEDMNKRVTGGIEQTIMNQFDDWTRKYHWDENSKNRHYFDGWRTNDAFAVNKKVIIPLNAYNHWSCCPDEFRAYKVRSKLSDIEKVFNYLDGGRALEVSLDDVLDMTEKTGQTKRVMTKHFFLTFYKKGTCHVEFRDMDLLAKFNIFAARNKKWLPPSFGKKHYKDMDSEEKRVVKSFMGSETAYEQVVARADYFLTDANEMLKLAE